MLDPSRLRIDLFVLLLRDVKYGEEAILCYAPLFMRFRRGFASLRV